MSIKKPTTADILVPNVDVQLLRKQRDAILNAGDMRIEAVEEHIDGVLNLLDTMLDIAEGFSQRDPHKQLLMQLISNRLVDGVHIQANGLLVEFVDEEEE